MGLISSAASIRRTVRNETPNATANPNESTSTRSSDLRPLTSAIPSPVSSLRSPVCFPSDLWSLALSFVFTPLAKIVQGAPRTPPKQRLRPVFTGPYEKSKNRTKNRTGTRFAPVLRVEYRSTTCE